LVVFLLHVINEYICTVQTILFRSRFLVPGFKSFKCLRRVLDKLIDERCFTIDELLDLFLWEAACGQCLDEAFAFARAGE